MEIVQCPHCGATARAPRPGRYQCPKCGGIVEVAATAPVEPPPLNDQVFSDRDGTADLFYRRFASHRRYRHLGIVWVMGLINIPIGLVAALCLSNLTYIVPAVWYVLGIVPFTCWWSIRATTSILSLKQVSSLVAVALTLGSIILCGGGGFFLGLLYHVDPRDIMPFSHNPIFEAAEKEVSFWILATLAGMYLGSFLAVHALLQVERLQSTS